MHLRGAGNTIITCKNLQVQHTLIRKDLGYWEYHDTQTGMPFGIPKGARCVQRFDDSLNSAIHITYRISLRSSSMREPRDPLLKVVFQMCQYTRDILNWFIGLWSTQKQAAAKRHKGPTATTCPVKSAQRWEENERDVHMPKRPATISPDWNSIMILPQVHLRKPCYDFYFL